MYATDLPTVLADVAEALTAAGIPSSTDPTTVPVPGCWVTVDTMNADRLAGDWSVTGALYLFARDNGHNAAIAVLSAMIATVAEVFPSAATAVPDSLALPGHPGPLPAFRITIDIGD